MQDDSFIEERWQHLREAKGKVQEAVEEWNKENVAVVVHLGDIIDGQDSRVSPCDVARTYLKIEHSNGSRRSIISYFKSTFSLSYFCQPVLPFYPHPHRAFSRPAICIMRSCNLNYSFQ